MVLYALRIPEPEGGTMKEVGMEEAARRLPHFVKEGEIGVIMATRAYWGGVNLSREIPSPVSVIQEEENGYLGRWSDDFDDLNVWFPKETSRLMRESEVRRFRHPEYHLEVTYSIAA